MRRLLYRHSKRTAVSSHHPLICAIALLVCFIMCFAVVPSVSPSQAAAKLKAPSKVKCSDKTYRSITLKWKKVKRAKGYNIYLCRKGGKFKKVKTVKGGGKSSCKVSGLKKKTVYKVYIKACKAKSGKGAGKKSKTISVKTLGPETYTISPSSIPRNKKMLRYRYYNKYTRMYYTLRSYMERFEKCSGGTLILKKGTYNITNTIFVPSNVTIKLSDGAVIKKGKNTHLRGLKASNSLFHFVKPSKGHSKKVYGGYNGAKNIKLIGTGSAAIDMSYQGKSNCIEAGHNRNVTISGITFRNVSSGHFIELDATKNAVIRNCTFMNISDSKNVREAINFDTPDKATGGFSAAWSKMDKTADKNITVVNCNFKNMPRAIGTHSCSYGHPHRYISIRNCKIDSVSSFGIGIMYWRNFVITGCTINGKYKNGKNTYDGILGYGITNAGVYNNYISNFRYPMLFKDYRDKAFPKNQKIYNNLNGNDLKLLSLNTCEKTLYDFVFVYNNNNGKYSARIPISMTRAAQTETDAAPVEPETQMNEPENTELNNENPAEEENAALQPDVISDDSTPSEEGGIPSENIENQQDPETETDN